MQKELRQKLIDLNDSRVNARLGITKFEAGKWYKSTDSKFMVFLTEFKGKYDGNGYFFNAEGHWKGFDSIGLGRCVEATTEEVERRLIKEAIRRRFKDGVHINNSSLGFNHE